MAREKFEGLTELEVLARIANDLREVRNYLRAWWWLFWVGAVLLVLAQANST